MIRGPIGSCHVARPVSVIGPRGTSRGDWPTTRADQIWQHLIGQPGNPRIPKVVVVVGVAEMPVNVAQKGYAQPVVGFCTTTCRVRSGNATRNEMGMKWGYGHLYSFNDQHHNSILHVSSTNEQHT